MPSPIFNKGARHPEALHTRKPSLTNSVSSSDSSSTQSTRSTATMRHTRVLDFDPLSLHPTFHAPPRLYERPFIHNSQSIEDEVINSYFSSQEAAAAAENKAKASFAAAIPDMPVPPVDSPRTPIQQQERSREHAAEGDDYFLFKVQQHIASTRPQLPRSHWSESTINTLASQHDDDDEDDQDSSEDGSFVDEERPVRESQWRNFSIKRSSPSTVRRPAMKSLDSVEDFIKRGGWKRRGIVFGQESARTSNTLF
ncbi:hypothetical protein COL5a_010961 [Colletotrichum fioriniae]|uniref:uncharacterized protein n=1 Tax=Colletotrichum fioriniae TaxID=710243 RepID=UPI002300E0A4|nr:uncharacterized protein COL516b_012133 [Colletotrichum fioriniae]KAJ0295887.1 hypothetical protein COL516b_012133 [Colletotrichum fioriniae]KAJ0317773.1 hypothetical protein COL5a_010961 [Colletotrichum fioriniae]KAJ3939473.1 hypothetical protein N0V96_010249 [Colletotrichum fioriniae]